MGVFYINNDVFETKEIIDYINNYPERCYIIDNLPKKIPVDSYLKFDRIEKRINDDLYKAIYKLLITLWLYKETNFESKILFGEERIFAKKPLKVFLLHLGRLIIKKNKRITKPNSLKIILYLSKRNIIDLRIYCDNNSIAIIPSWNSFFIYIENDENVDIIKKLCQMKGLYFKEWSSY